MVQVLFSDFAKNFRIIFGFLQPIIVSLAYVFPGLIQVLMISHIYCYILYNTLATLLNRTNITVGAKNMALNNRILLENPHINDIFKKCH